MTEEKEHYHLLAKPYKWMMLLQTSTGVETACSWLRALRMRNDGKEWERCIWKWHGSKIGGTVSHKSDGPGLRRRVWGHVTPRTERAERGEETEGRAPWGRGYVYGMLLVASLRRAARWDHGLPPRRPPGCSFQVGRSVNREVQVNSSTLRPSRRPALRRR